MILSVFGSTVDFTSAPKFIQYQALLITGKWGTDLDVRTPTFVRVYARRIGRKYGLPGTPL